MSTSFYLANTDDRHSPSDMERFDPRFWVVNFSRPMLSTIQTLSDNSFRVELAWYLEGDLGGLIWESVDRWDHPLLTYKTSYDYSGVTLNFDWVSSNVRGLDETQGPTLTIEGRDAEGDPRVWYVRLWNYATGTGENASISLDFDNLDGGFNLPADADPVYPNDIDRLFISLPQKIT